jgi:hypothetical protein
MARGLCEAHYSRFKVCGSARVDEPLRASKHAAGNPKWKGGVINDGHGRVLVYAPTHPNPSYCGTHVYRYRLVMERHLKRHLRTDEIVHHINGDHSDDRLENLQVVTRAEHARIHLKNRRFAAIT